MNFTAKIKRELLLNGFDSACCKQAAISAFIRSTGTVGMSDSKTYFECTSESLPALEYFSNLILAQYGAKGVLIQKNRDVWVCRIQGDKVKHILFELGIIESKSSNFVFKLGIDKYLIEERCCGKSYIIGVFLGSGSCQIPTAGSKSKGYHLEFVLTNNIVAKDFTNLLERYGIKAKVATRKDVYIVYLKSGEVISDFLALVNATVSVLQLTEIIVRKTRTNDINRAVNCQTGNLTKQFDASIRQIKAIKVLEADGRLRKLPSKLYQTALARLNGGKMSLSELADSLNITKSCLNHRLRKIVEISTSK